MICTTRGVGSTPFDGWIPVNAKISQREIEQLGCCLVTRECTPVLDDLAQAAVGRGFFRMSRSALSSVTSRFNRAISACSGFNCPWPGKE